MFAESQSSLVRRANQFAETAHASVNQLRDNGDPYIVHPRAVARILFQLGYSEIVLAAALLHDTVEDTPVTFAEIEDSFGKEVSTLVEWLTKDSDPSIGNRKARKAHECDRISKAPYLAKCIKLADITNNIEDVVKGNPAFAKVYIPEKKAMLSVLKDADPRLMAMAEKAIGRAEDELALLPRSHKPQGMSI